MSPTSLTGNNMKLTDLKAAFKTPYKHPAAVALGRKGGKATSERKARAARRNGKKGGRPKVV